MTTKERIQKALEIFKENSWKGLVANILAMIMIFFFILILFFYVYLPFATNHNETITVPDLEHMPISEVEAFLEEKDLQYVVRDTVYSPKYKPLTVIAQHPLKGAQVKVNRKVYLTINSEKPTEVEVKSSKDELIGKSVNQVKNTLKSYGLKVSPKTKYQPDKFANAVLGIEIDGKFYGQNEIDAGFKLYKGTEVIIVAGDGLGESKEEMPRVTGKPLDEAEFVLSGFGISIDSISYEKNPDYEPCTVIKQSVSAGTKVKVGSFVNLVVVECPND